MEDIYGHMLFNFLHIPVKNRKTRKTKTNKQKQKQKYNIQANIILHIILEL